jgi:ELWxxDGT repeat protein
MPAATTLLQRVLAAGAALSLVAALGASAGVARAITPPTITVLDINPEGDSYALDDDDTEAVAVGDLLLFAADDDTHGRDLYKSDGTVAGTVLVKDINPSFNAGVEYMVAMGNTAYFRADNGTDGDELWKSDGTEAGTVMVKDINPSGNSFPRDLFVVGSTIYFEATDGTNGEELWKSDGTTAGTVMVKDINPSGDSNPQSFAAIGSTLYFEASNGTDGYELWKSDGTTAGTVMVKNIDTSSNSGNIRAITRHGNLIYFQARDAVNGEEMYLSDGTEAGTMRIPAPTATDYISCDCYDNPVMSTSIGVFFTYYDSTVGHELGFIGDRLPETNTNSSALTLALLALSGALAAGAVIARRAERRAN